jgi:tetratricopeptide (TPR) repeat protein
MRESLESNILLDFTVIKITRSDYTLIGYFFLVTLLVQLSTVQAQLKTDNSCTQAATMLREVLNSSPEKNRNIDQIERYQAAIKLCPSMAEAYYNLGIFQVRDKNFKEGLENLKKAHEKKPEGSQFLAAYATGVFESGDRQLAKDLYEKALLLDPHSIKTLQGMSVIAERAGDLEQSIVYLERAEREDPNNTVTLFNLGLIKERQGLTSDAAKIFEKLLKADDSHAQAGIRLVVIYIAQERIVEAQQLLGRMLEQNPRDIDALKLSASLQTQTNDQGKAVLSLKRALEVEPDNKKILLPLAGMLLKQGSADQARTLIERARVKNPADFELLDLLGQATMELGDLALAEESFKRALAANALSAHTHYNYSVLLRRLGRTQESEQQRDAAFKIDPTLVREAEGVEQQPR